MAARRLQPEPTRRRLLDAAAEVIVAHGWGGVTTRVVAARAGVRPGLVHYHFGSVDELRREAALDTLRRVIDPFTVAAASMSPRELVEAAVEASVHQYGPGTDVANLMYEVIPGATRDPELRAALQALLAEFREAVAGTIRRHHRAPLAPPEVLAEVIAATIDGLQLHLLADPHLDMAAHLEPVLALLGPPVAPEDR